MRISFIVPWITQGRGGTENVGHLMANAMARKNHDVHVYTFDDQKRPPTWPLDPGIKLHHLPEGDRPHADRQMAMALAEACPDLIVGLHLNRTMLRYSVAAQKIGIPLVLSEHIDPHFPERLGTFPKEHRVAAFTGATRIHLLNNSFIETVPERLRGRISVVPNTVTTASARCDPAGGPKKQLITVGRLVSRKNFGQLINEFSLIAEKHRDWSLRILGDGPLMKDLKQRAMKAGISDQVEFAGHSDSPYEHYEKSQLFVLPSFFEGFPMSSLEAMTHGMPLVGFSACNGINEQIVDGVNGRLATHGLRQGQLAACLDHLMSDEELRVKMGEESRRRFDRLYSNQIVFDAWETMFRQALTEGPVRIELDTDAGASYRLWERANGGTEI